MEADGEKAAETSVGTPAWGWKETMSRTPVSVVHPVTQSALSTYAKSEVTLSASCRLLGAKSLEHIFSN